MSKSLTLEAKMSGYFTLDTENSSPNPQAFQFNTGAQRVRQCVKFFNRTTPDGQNRLRSRQNHPISASKKFGRAYGRTKTLEAVFHEGLKAGVLRIVHNRGKAPKIEWKNENKWEPLKLEN